MFLDATKIFDRVHYCKLFTQLINRGFPLCIIRMLINLCTENDVNNFTGWGNFSCNYGVKQGGFLTVLYPILFCVDIHGLLTLLT